MKLRLFLHLVEKRLRAEGSYLAHTVSGRTVRGHEDVACAFLARGDFYGYALEHQGRVYIYSCEDYAEYSEYALKMDEVWRGWTPTHMPNRFRAVSDAVDYFLGR